MNKFDAVRKVREKVDRSRMNKIAMALFALGALSVTADANPSTKFSAAGANCIPTSSTGVSISGGTLTNTAAATTLTCYVAVSKGDFDGGTASTIEIVTSGASTKGGAPGTNCTLYQLDKATGTESVMGGISSSVGSSSVRASSALLITNLFDWDANFYYIRCGLTTTSGSLNTQTLLGVSLTI